MSPLRSTRIGSAPAARGLAMLGLVPTIVAGAILVWTSTPSLAADGRGIAVQLPAGATAQSLTVANGQFADGVVGWAAANPSTRLSRSGKGHLDHGALRATSSSRQSEVVQVSPAAVASAVGLHAEAWVRTSQSAKVSLQLVDAAGGSTLATVTQPVPSGRWVQVAVTSTGSFANGTRPGVRVVTSASARRITTLVDGVAVQMWTPPAPVVPTSLPTAVPSALPPVPTSVPTAPPVLTAPTTLATGAWLSGASGTGVATGEFAQWRNRDVDIAGTWNDSAAAQLNQWTLASGAEYGSWGHDLDVAIGGIYKNDGDSWAAAAQGDYDTRWSAALTKLADDRRGRSGTVYIRFAHEFNGNWYPWSVSASEEADFVAAWKRFRALQLSIMPQAKLVFCPSSQTSWSQQIDWRDTYPGPGQVDVLGVDFYNQWPYVDTAAGFDQRLAATDYAGAPAGLEGFRAFAAAHGVPLAIPEWSSNADMGDSAAFMTSMHAWLDDHGGSGPGQVLYEILFNVGGFDSGQFQLFPVTRQDSAASVYHQLW